jgi:two-component system OmpR family sensor kinase
MVVAIAALAALGILVTDTAGILVLRSQLIRRVDGQLDGQARLTGRALADYINSASATAGQPRHGPLIGPLSHFALYSSGGKLLFSDPQSTSQSSTSQSSPDLGGFGQLKRHAGGHAYTVNGWRVLVNTVKLSLCPAGYRCSTSGSTTDVGTVATGISVSGYAVSAVSLADVQDTEDKLLLIDVAVSAAVLLLIGFAAATVVRIGLRPLTRMERFATEIAGGAGAGEVHPSGSGGPTGGGDLSRRVEDADPHTESGRLGTALNAMLGQIETALAARTGSEQRLRQFLADASHELRTPLTSIQGFAELYRRGGAPPGPALDEAMGRIESEVGRMRLLVGDLLLLARMDEERPLGQHPVDLLEVAADTVRDAHVRVPTRFVLLDGYDTLEPVTVLGDEARIRQVATNLVVNALQHTPDDARIQIRVGRPALDRETEAPVASIGEPLPAAAPVAALEVVDTGPGMAAEEARRVFERLYRVDASRSRSQGGAGLGLSIVAAIVQAHGGRVELWTTPGHGARFRVLLPAEASNLDDELRGSSEET